MPDEVTKRRFAELAQRIARLLTELKRASHVLNNDGAQLHHDLNTFLTQLERVSAEKADVVRIRGAIDFAWQVFQDEGMARIEASLDELDLVSIEIGQLTANLPKEEKPKKSRRKKKK